MEKQTKQPPLWWLLGLLLCCVAFGAQAEDVKIEGYTSIGTYKNFPLFLIDSPQITVSSSSGSFNRIYIDDNQVAYNDVGYWSSCPLDISSYLDGGYHKLQLMRGSSNLGICYFINLVEQVSIDGIEYGLTNNNNAAVIGSADDIEEANIPATISNDGVEYSVKSISIAAFANRTKLHTVTIPESVTSISNSAFKGCSALTTLNFNAINCESCTSSSFPSTITNLTIGEKVTTIPDYFLRNGSKIENLTIPNSVTSIGSCAFLNSTNLKGVVIPPSVTTIGSYAFSGCNNLVKNAYPDNLSNRFSSGV
ncbi:MAG: leucine-rich repeat domain-containing protein, partial [Muribaculaceae bacterium]|nr:leucine-rich repeat domain-containing protein [Muribaculaceae bacterium]